MRASFCAFLALDERLYHGLPEAFHLIAHCTDLRNATSTWEVFETAVRKSAQLMPIVSPGSKWCLPPFLGTTTSTSHDSMRSSLGSWKAKVHWKRQRLRLVCLFAVTKFYYRRFSYVRNCGLDRLRGLINLYKCMCVFFATVGGCFDSHFSPGFL